MILLASVGPLHAQTERVKACPPGRPLKGPEVLIGYTGEPSESSADGVIEVGAFRALAILDGQALLSTHGSSIREGMRFWPVLSPESEPVVLADVLGHPYRFVPDECVYHARVVPSLSRWTLIATKPLPGVFRAPSEADLAAFRALDPSCVVQGDHDTPVPCERPRLVAVSDVDRNGKPEYWATDPAMWDTGFTIQEQGPDGKRRYLAAVCPCCSD